MPTKRVASTSRCIRNGSLCNIFPQLLVVNIPKSATFLDNTVKPIQIDHLFTANRHKKKYFQFIRIITFELLKKLSSFWFITKFKLTIETFNRLSQRRRNAWLQSGWYFRHRINRFFRRLMCCSRRRCFLNFGFALELLITRES